MTLTKIRKRDGRLAEFNEEKIARAIEKAFNATYKPGRGEEARKLADEVLSILEVEAVLPNCLHQPVQDYSCMSFSVCCIHR